MAESPSSSSEPGAPHPRGEIDPDLIKLSRARTKVGLITSAGVVFLCALFLVRLGPDRAFGGASDTAAPATVDDIVHDRVATEQLVTVDAELVVSRAIRATNAKGSLGMRVVPVRATADKLWIAASGDGWDPPALHGYTGRLRKLDDLAFADAIRSFATEQPQPVFATVAAARAGFASGQVATVAGDTIAVHDGDRVAADMVDPASATIAASFNERLPDTAAWQAALGKAGLAQPTAGKVDDALGQIRFTVAEGTTAATAKLEKAGLFAARVEPITRHVEATWGALRASPPGQLALGGTFPEGQLELLGLYVPRALPGDAYVIVTGEQPADYWYVMPVTIALAALTLVFAWALVRAVRRDLLPTRA